MKSFDSWVNAFSYCQGYGAGIIVKIISPAEEPGEYKLFPSGCCRAKNTSDYIYRNPISGEKEKREGEK